MNTFNQLWGVKLPHEAEATIKDQIADAGIIYPTNLEEQAISMVGTDIYEKLFDYRYGHLACHSLRFEREVKGNGALLPYQ